MVSYILLNSCLPTHPLRVEHHTLNYDPSFLKEWMPTTNMPNINANIGFDGIEILFFQKV